MDTRTMLHTRYYRLLVPWDSRGSFDDMRVEDARTLAVGLPWGTGMRGGDPAGRRLGRGLERGR